MLYGVYTESELDQVCATKAQANKEARELRALGYSVAIVNDTEHNLYMIDGMVRAGMSVAKAKRELAKGVVAVPVALAAVDARFEELVTLAGDAVCNLDIAFAHDYKGAAYVAKQVHRALNLIDAHKGATYKAHYAAQALALSSWLAERY